MDRPDDEDKSDEVTVVVRVPPATWAVTRIAKLKDPGDRKFEPRSVVIEPKPNLYAPTRVLRRPGPPKRRGDPLSERTVLNGRYEILKTIESGGFSYVYLCASKQNGTLHAIKEAIPTGGVRLSDGGVGGRAEDVQECRDAILREASVIAHTSHPGVVKLDEIFEQNNTLYISMQFVEGESLATLLTRRGAVSYRTIATIGGSIIDAMGYLHDRDILHGDIKPANVLLRPNESTVLVDFGSAERLSDVDRKPLTVSRGYAAPERYLVDGSIGPWSDIYGCAAVLAAMLAGKEPPPSSQMPSDPSAWLETAIPRPAQDTAEKQLRAGIAAALARKPRDRPQSADEFLGTLGLAGRNASSQAPQTDEESGSIFISYSSKDKAAVEPFVRALQLRGLSVWIDWQSIPPGEVWGRAIARGLNGARLVLVFSSLNSMKSKHVCNEVSFASNKRKKIVPVRLDKTPFGDMELFFASTQDIEIAKLTPDKFADIAANLLDQLD